MVRVDERPVYVGDPTEWVRAALVRQHFPPIVCDVKAVATFGFQEASPPEHPIPTVKIAAEILRPLTFFAVKLTSRAVSRIAWSDAGRSMGNDHCPQIAIRVLERFERAEKARAQLAGSFVCHLVSVRAKQRQQLRLQRFLEGACLHRHRLATRRLPAPQSDPGTSGTPPCWAFARAR